jgi:hypothetical protein
VVFAAGNGKCQEMLSFRIVVEPGASVASTRQVAKRLDLVEDASGSTRITALWTSWLPFSSGDHGREAGDRQGEPAGLTVGGEGSLRTVRRREDCAGGEDAVHCAAASSDWARLVAAQTDALVVRSARTP